MHTNIFCSLYSSGRFYCWGKPEAGGAECCCSNVLALQMGIAELRNQTRLQMQLKKLALPGEGEEGTLTSSCTPAYPTGRRRP